MENEKSLFDLQLDSLGKSHLKETAKWARFLAIVGFIGLGLVFIFIIVAAVNGNRSAGYNNYGTPVNQTENIAATVIGTIIGIALYFFPCYFLLKFANKMNQALAADDIASLNEAFKNLKVTFRYVGILTIIFLALFALGMLAGIAGGD